MLRRASVFVALLGLSLAGFPGGSDACVLTAAGDHACCTGTAPQSTASCCADGPEPVPATGFDCDCDHRANTPTTAPQSTRSAEREHGICTLRPAVDSTVASVPPVVLEEATSAPPGQPPPPLFLLDCAFLI